MRDEVAAVRRLITAVEQSAAADGGMIPEAERWLERVGAVVISGSPEPLAGELDRMLASNDFVAEEVGKPLQPERWSYGPFNKTKEHGCE